MEPIKGPQYYSRGLYLRNIKSTLSKIARILSLKFQRCSAREED